MSSLVDSLTIHSFDLLCVLLDSVWAWAVFVWECFNDARLPYDDITSTLGVCRKVIDGYRLSYPDELPKFAQALCAECMSRDPRDRPTFQEIVAALDDTADEVIYASLAALREDM
jgi:Protein tyrosine and serine/threonine kinase